MFYGPTQQQPPPRRHKPAQWLINSLLQAISKQQPLFQNLIEIKLHQKNDARCVLLILLSNKWLATGCEPKKLPIQVLIKNCGYLKREQGWGFD